MKLTKVQMDPLNRMARLGFGKHDGKRFARLDLWFLGFRLTSK